MGLKAKFTQGAGPRGILGQQAVEEASPVDEAEALDGLPSEIAELASRKLRFKLGVRRELKALPTILAEGEEVLNLAAGGYDGHQGLLIVTDRRLIFYEKGVMRSTQEDFPYSKLSSIQTETKMTSGRLIIFVSGNRAVINQVLPRERVNEIGGYVRERMTAHDADTSPAPESSGDRLGPGERLQQLSGVFEAGLISSQEYETKRASILGEL